MKPITIVMADDDPDDQYLAQAAFNENRIANELYFVNNGEELLDYLLHRGRFNKENAPRPGLILLDINMPKMNGLDALKEIKKHDSLKRIPVVILTTSKSDADVVSSYNLGVSSFISKPVSFEELVEVTKKIGQYWFGIVVLPEN